MDVNGEEAPELLTEEEFKRASSKVLLRELYAQTVFLQFQVDDVRKELAKQARSLHLIEEALARTTHIRGRIVRLRYYHDSYEIYISNSLIVGFKPDSQEALLLSIMFKKDGAPKKTKWQCVEVADRFKKKGYSLNTKDKVYKAALRIQDRILKATNVEGVLSISKNEFSIVATL